MFLDQTRTRDRVFTTKNLGGDLVCKVGKLLSFEVELGILLCKYIFVLTNKFFL